MSTPLSDAEYLRDIADRLMYVASSRLDGGDMDDLRRIAKNLDAAKASGISEGLEMASRWLGTEAQKRIDLADGLKSNSFYADVVRLEARHLVRYATEIRFLPTVQP